MVNAEEDSPPRLKGNAHRTAEQREYLRRTQPRRGLSAVQAATYLGVKPHKFDQLVGEGRLPQPRLFDGVLVWDIDELDQAFDTMPRREKGSGPPKPWELP